MKAILTLVRDLLVRRSQERMIKELDEYTLRDIGLEREAQRARAPPHEFALRRLLR